MLSKRIPGTAFYLGLLGLLLRWVSPVRLSAAEVAAARKMDDNSMALRQRLSFVSDALDAGKIDKAPSKRASVL